VALAQFALGGHGGLRDHNHDHGMDNEPQEHGHGLKKVLSDMPPLTMPSGAPQTHGPKFEVWYCCQCKKGGPLKAVNNTHCPQCYQKRCSKCPSEWLS
jgi:hypothetical protein